MKKTIFVFALCIIASCSTMSLSVSAESALTEKEQFVKQCDAYVAQNGFISPFSEIDRDDLYFEIVKNNPENTEEALNRAGFFTYSAPEEIYRKENEIQLFTQDPNAGLVKSNSPGDVALNAPTVTWDAGKRTWKITASGYWKNANWKTADLGYQPDGYGNTMLLGDKDIYGFVFSDAEDTYNTLGISVVDSKISCNPLTIYKNTNGQYNKDHTYQFTNTNRHQASGRGGVLMEVADNLVITHSYYLWYRYDYGADTFNMVVNYNENFSKFHGNVSTYMHHNYSITKLDNVSFSFTADNNKYVSASVNIGITNRDYSWQAYSGSQTRF